MAINFKKIQENYFTSTYFCIITIYDCFSKRKAFVQF